MNKLTVVDLFAGAGGLSKGLEMAGFECILGTDFDKAAMETFRYNHPNAKTLVGDIQKMDSETILETLNGRNVNVVCGGPPCQGFSTVGPGDADDARNHLFLDFVRVVKLLEPEFVIIENVTGLLAKKNEKTLIAILESMEQLGYTIDVKVLSAHHYGVPERRRRTIFIANKYGIRNIYPIPRFGDTIKGVSDLPPPRTVDWAFRDLMDNRIHNQNHDVAAAQIPNELERHRIHHIPEGKGVRYERDQLAYLPEELWYDVDWENIAEKRFRETKLQRLSFSDCSPTINTSKTVYYHPTEDRYLTAREAAAIQSFPKNFFFFGTLGQQWRQIGNAVPPLLAKSIGEAILVMEQGKYNLPKSESEHDIKYIRSHAFNYGKDVSKHLNDKQLLLDLNE